MREQLTPRIEHPFALLAMEESSITFTGSRQSGCQAIELGRWPEGWSIIYQ